MSTTKEKEVIWEDADFTLPPKKSVLPSISEECDITADINVLNGSGHLLDTTKTKVSGIYKIVNKVNGKYYVGSSDHLRRRLKIHYNRLNRGQHENPHLQNAWNKYGKYAFQFTIIKYSDIPNLLIIEQSYLDICKSSPDSSYNISYDAIAPMRGRPHTPETKQKMAESHIGIRNVMFGKHHHQDTIQKIKEARKKQVFSKEHREKQSIAQRIPTVHKFFNFRTNEYFNGTQFEFRNKTGINPYYLLSGIRPRYCWWTIL